jgi:16S rRNA (adenine1518-N6/adenine1519-N6)-dimethyltransferase
MSKAPRANKELGQHYLKDQTVIDKIIQDEPSDYDYIVEIGPGPATLTKDLNKLNKDIYLIEMDKRFDDHLNELNQVKKIFYEDALRFNWDDFVQEHPGKIWLVSNLPYNISSQLFISFLKVEAITHMTLMYQKEVGEKTFIRPQTKNQMGSLCV